MRYELYIFDMDGTILDTLEDLTDSLNYMLEKMGYPTHSITTVRKFVGNGIRRLIERAVPIGTKKDKIDQIFDEFTEYYKLHCAQKTKPYDGIKELLVELHNKGCKTAVVSNKPDAAVQELCEMYFKGLFDCAIGEKINIKRKPAPDSVNFVLEELHVKRERAVYIGDSEVDIATAENAELPCITVSWGFRDIEFLKENGADIIISRPSQILCC